uniref:Uncharacterized protein LOC101242234 n=1 Tax=Phallusia mammillata TaxID=59560 RepID=A0A6F9DIQ0_9ASCI|nr:uncharacterized protein LOC101242234 [Phallusia mammillata]
MISIIVALLSAAVLPCFGSQTECRTVLHQMSGEIYYNTWEDGQRNCSWLFGDLEKKPNRILILKFIHLRYMQGPGLILPDGTRAEGKVHRHLYTDNTELPWCGVYVSATSSDSDVTSSCENVANEYCHNSIQVSQHWPAMLQVTGKNLIFLATYSSIDCDDSAISVTSDVPCDKVGFIMIGVVTILFLAVVVLATLLHKSRKNRNMKYGITDRNEPVYTLIRFYRRTFGKSAEKNAKQGLIARGGLCSNTDTDQEMVPIPTKHPKVSMSGESTYCATIQCDVHKPAVEREMEPGTSSSHQLYANLVKSENVYLQPITSITSLN